MLPRPGAEREGRSPRPSRAPTGPGLARSPGMRTLRWQSQPCEELGTRWPGAVLLSEAVGPLGGGVSWNPNLPLERLKGK